ncbi:MAG: class I SAM-dependent methyltransferase [Phycisphaerae bacterium]|jgi:ubiquinone/menaquinone biosynthesis C-methylase UbiE
MRNRQTYERADVVGRYAIATELFGAEQALLSRWAPRLGEWSMLDLGVGGGRTTLHFAPLAQRYVGTDYAQGMVQACRERFRDQPRWQFEHCDARDMKRFDEASFDLVLFSFNGLDYIPHEDRLKALREIRRLLKPRGIFAFSAHNLNAVGYPLRWRRTGGISRLPADLLRWTLLRLYNARTLLRIANAPHARINDGTYRFGLQTYYIRPRAQLAQLEAAGFDSIEIFAQGTGEDLTKNPDNQDAAPYYVCHRADERHHG